MIAQVKLDPARVVEVLDWCHGVHHLSLALAALDLAQDRRAEQYGRLRTLLRAGQSQIVIEELERLGGPARRLARVEGDPLLEETLRGGTTAVQLFQVPWCTAGERCDREHDSPGDQPSTQGERHLLDGGQRGSGVPTAGCRRIRALGRDRGTHAGSDGEGPPNGLCWTPPECLAELKELDEEDDDVTQTSTRKQSKRSAA